MSVLQDATLNLATLLKLDPELGEELSGEGELMPAPEVLSADGIKLSGPLHWRLTVRATGEGEFFLTGSVEGPVEQECRRCLTDVRTPVRARLVYPMLYRPQKGSKGLRLLEEDEDDVLVFSQPEVDFAPLLAQVFAIESPLTVLCREDCRGLSLDGVNLNEHPEHAPPASRSGTPSPFESLKDLEL